MRKLDRFIVLGVLLFMTVLTGRILAQNGGNGGNGGGGNGGGGGSSACTCAAGATNCFSGVNVPSVNSTTAAQGTFTTPDIPATSSNEVVIDGCAVSTTTGAPVEVRWRVRANQDPTKLFQLEDDSVNQQPVMGPPVPAGQQFNTFNATVVNYDQTNPPVNFRLSLNPCVISLSTASISVASNGKSGQLGVSVSPAACQWPVTSTATWIHFSATTGTGSGTLGYTIDANTMNAERTATATIGGQAFTVTELPPGGCPSTISPSAVTVGSVSSSGSVSVNINPGCPWSSSSSYPWITVSGSGAGSGVATYTVAVNTDPSSRTGTAVIAGQPFTVTQQGAGCTFIINPPSITITHFAYTDDVTLTSAVGCPWSASSNVSWISVNPTTGTGPYPVQYNVAANTDPVQRTGTLTIAGLPFTVTQLPGICAMISPTSAGFSAQSSGQVNSVAVTAPVSCNWTAASTVPWITVQGGSSGSGYGTVTYTVDDNLTGADRSGSITIGGNSFFVSQTAN